MTTVYLKTEEYHHVTQERDPDDEWDAGCSDTEVTFLGASLTQPGYPYESFEYPNSIYYSLDEKWNDDASETIEVGDTIYVTICRYGTGSTFGSDGGQIAIILATKDQAKAELALHPENLKKKVAKGQWSGYLPYEGYFEWLQDLYVKSFVVGK